jgi:hypothetical protein
MDIPDPRGIWNHAGTSEQSLVREDQVRSQGPGVTREVLWKNHAQEHLRRHPFPFTQYRTSQQRRIEARGSDPMASGSNHSPSVAPERWVTGIGVFAMPNLSYPATTRLAQAGAAWEAVCTRGRESQTRTEELRGLMMIASLVIDLCRSTDPSPACSRVFRWMWRHVGGMPATSIAAVLVDQILDVHTLRAWQTQVGLAWKLGSASYRPVVAHTPTLVLFRDASPVAATRQLPVSSDLEASILRVVDDLLSCCKTPLDPAYHCREVGKGVPARNHARARWLATGQWLDQWDSQHTWNTNDATPLSIHGAKTSPEQAVLAMTPDQLSHHEARCVQFVWVDLTIQIYRAQMPRPGSEWANSGPVSSQDVDEVVGTGSLGLVRQASRLAGWAGKRAPRRCGLDSINGWYAMLGGRDNVTVPGVPTQAAKDAWEFHASTLISSSIQEESFCIRAVGNLTPASLVDGMPGGTPPTRLFKSKARVMQDCPTRLQDEVVCAVIQQWRVRTARLYLRLGLAHGTDKEYVSAGICFERGLQCILPALAQMLSQSKVERLRHVAAYPIRVETLQIASVCWENWGWVMPLFTSGVLCRPAGVVSLRSLLGSTTPVLLPDALSALPYGARGASTHRNGVAASDLEKWNWSTVLDALEAHQPG